MEVDDDTLLFTSEYEREYRTADMHSVSWYDWMLNRPDAPEEEVRAGGSSEAGEEYSEPDDTYSWGEEDDDGIKF